MGDSVGANMTLLPSEKFGICGYSEGEVPLRDRSRFVRACTHQGRSQAWSVCPAEFFLKSRHHPETPHQRTPAVTPVKTHDVKANVGFNVRVDAETRKCDKDEEQQLQMLWVFFLY